MSEFRKGKQKQPGAYRRPAITCTDQIREFIAVKRNSFTGFNFKTQTSTVLYSDLGGDSKASD